jgi:hypothetical protein
MPSPNSQGSIWLLMMQMIFSPENFLTKEDFCKKTKNKGEYRRI